LFCERCGLLLYPRQSVCSRCGATATRHWLQLIGFGALTVAIGCNSLVALYFLPRFITGHGPSLLFRAWLWFNDKVSLYGWVTVALALLTWGFWPRPGCQQEKEARVARWLLVLLLLAGMAATLLPWLPATLAGDIRAAIENHPGLTPSLAWGTVALAVGILCLNAETRDSLIGEGKALSLVGLGLVLLMLVMVLLGWSAAQFPAEGRNSLPAPLPKGTTHCILRLLALATLPRVGVQEA